MLSKHITGQLLAALFLELTGEEKAYFLNNLGRGVVSIPEDFPPIDFQYVEVEGDYAIQYLHEQQEGYALWEDGQHEKIKHQQEKAVNFGIRYGAQKTDIEAFITGVTNAPIQGRVADQKWLDEANTLPVQATYSRKENPPEFHEIGEARIIAGDVLPPCHIIQRVSDYYKNIPNDPEE